MLGDDARRQLLGGHFKGKEADDAAVGGLDHAVGAGSAPIGLGDVEGDVGGQSRLAHAGTAREDDEVGRLEAAHVAVEIGKAGRDAAERPLALVGARGHVDSDLQRVGKALEAAVVTPGLGDLIEAPFGLLDLIARARIDGRVIGDVDDVLADRDQFAPHGEVVDVAAVVVGVDDGRRFASQAGEILRHGDAVDVMLAEESFQRDRRRELAGANHRSGDLENAAMDLLDEMFAAEEIGDAVEGVVIDQDGAEQRLFGVEIVGRSPIGALRRCVLALQQLFDRRHRRGRVFSQRREKSGSNELGVS